MFLNFTFKDATYSVAEDNVISFDDDTIKLNAGYQILDILILRCCYSTGGLNDVCISFGKRRIFPQWFTMIGYDYNINVGGVELELRLMSNSHGKNNRP